MIVLDKNEVYDISKLTTDELQQVIDAMQKIANAVMYLKADEQRLKYPENTFLEFDEDSRAWFFTFKSENAIDARELFRNTPTKESILREAERIINGSRAEDYGDVTENFKKIADGWSVIFGVEVSPRQVGHAMIWLKTCRDLNTPKRDNLVDIAGYAGCIDKMR